MFDQRVENDARPETVDQDQRRGQSPGFRQMGDEPGDMEQRREAEDRAVRQGIPARDRSRVEGDV